MAVVEQWRAWSNGSSVRAVVWLVAMLVLEGCAFLRPSTADPFGRSYADLTALIDEAEQARATGVQPEAWASRLGLPATTDGRAWDARIGELYACRASSLVRRAPVLSVTETWVGMMRSDHRRQSDASPLGLVIGCVLVVPPAVLLDVVLVPVSTCFSFVQDLRVDEVDRVRAQEDLKRAGELGMDPADLWMW